MGLALEEVAFFTTESFCVGELSLDFLSIAGCVFAFLTRVCSLATSVPNRVVWRFFLLVMVVCLVDDVVVVVASFNMPLPFLVFSVVPASASQAVPHISHCVLPLSAFQKVQAEQDHPIIDYLPNTPQKSAKKDRLGRASR